MKTPYITTNWKYTKSQGRYIGVCRKYKIVIEEDSLEELFSQISKISVKGSYIGEKSEIEVFPKGKFPVVNYVAKII